MKQICSVLLVILMFELFGCSKQSQSPVQAVATHPVQGSQATVVPSEPAHLFDGDFTIIETTDAVPMRCKSAFVITTKEAQFEMAEPGQRYGETDVGGGPFRRLIFAGIGHNECFIYYERGGRGHSYQVDVFDIANQNNAKYIWGGWSFTGVADLQQLRSEVGKGGFSRK
ncbi:MAG TPA: hypothetical protein VK699_15870 [Terriglobales bacterium]|jgi:hypothetical protein|nr:hypothetical protein [Terriglobales bacterium]